MYFIRVFIQNSIIVAAGNSREMANILILNFGKMKVFRGMRSEEMDSMQKKWARKKFHWKNYCGSNMSKSLIRGNTY